MVVITNESSYIVGTDFGTSHSTELGCLKGRVNATITESIQKLDLEPILATHSGTRSFARVLQHIASGDELLRALGRYTYFNSVFGSGVANLAGELAARQDLFRDPEEALEIIADRSVEVAADIFFSAIDEFGGHGRIRRTTHRVLAQATLKAAGNFFGYTPARLNHIARLNLNTLATRGRVLDGYGINQVVDKRKLFSAMGFHMGSEVLADEEFRTLDSLLRVKYPELVEYLEKTPVEIDCHRHSAYFWIHIHTSVEADHFESAMKSANRALYYYAGLESRKCIKNWILDGFTAFAAVQTEFMQKLIDQ